MARRATTKTISRPPNILVIFGDDIGYWNPSCYNGGTMGYQTPNIDRLAQEGARLTDFYGQQSCTAGRAAFITGQVPFRTGLSQIASPGASHGLRAADPTIAELLKPLGYATGHFGKHHLGDADETLPTAHGFDEFFGNLYNLNAEGEPEHPDYPKDASFRARFGPRGVIRSWAHADGTQRIEDTGPLDRARMETIDDETLAASLRFMERAAADQTPFFLWHNTTRMHIWTRLREERRGKTGLGDYADAMVEHDGHVGQLLEKLDELAIAERTIVVYTTDNGAVTATWPDAATTPFRGEKHTNWEGGWRVPCLVRWPGRVKPGTVITEMMSLEDWLPTLVAAAGVADAKEKLLDGHRVGEKTYRVHLDGYDQGDLLAGRAPTRRQEFFYFSDDGELLALRHGRWKAHFMEQRATGMSVWQEPFVRLRVPKLFDLLTDPFERGEEGLGYARWAVDHEFIFVPMHALITRFLKTFEEFPPCPVPGGFSVDRVLDALQEKASALEQPLAAAN